VTNDKNTYDIKVNSENSPKRRVAYKYYDMGERIMSKVSRSSINMLNELHSILGNNFKTYQPYNESVTHEQKPFYDKLGCLYDDCLDMSKSIKRGYRDLVKGDKLKTEMKQRINTEVLEPLREHINQDTYFVALTQYY